MINRNQLSKKLARDLGTGYVVVSGPDHPDLLAGPDILVGGEGRLTAVFCISRRTRNRDLHARVAATRLAFPALTRLVALIENNAKPTDDLVQQAFDDVLETTQERQLERLCVSQILDSPRVNEIRSVQRRHSTFYSTVLQIAELRHRHKLDQTNSRDVIASLRLQEPQPLFEIPSGRKSWFYIDWETRAIVNQTTVVALEDAPRRTASARLFSVWSEALSEDFVFDTGVPYSRRLSQPRVLLVDHWPVHRSDPAKPTRASAFGGWIMATPTTPAEIRRLIERASHAIVRRMT